MVKSSRILSMLAVTMAYAFISCGGGGSGNSDVLDITAPVPGNSGTITAGSVTDTSLVINWTAGTDNATGPLDLQYAVYQSTSGNITTITDCKANGSLIQNYSANLTTKTATGLSASTTYYFNVVVRDSAGNKACYSMKQQMTTAIPDTTVPVPGNSGTITAGSVTDTSLVINWTAGTDNVTGPLDLQYAVYKSASNTLTTVSGCEAATLIQDYSANLLTKSATGLSASTTYYFNVVVKDSAGNKACYTMKQQATTATPDTTPPVPGNSGTITAGSVTDTSLVLNWTVGTDNATGPLDLQYAVYKSASNTLSTVSGCEAATLIQDYSANLLTKTATGLSASTTYYFNVVVRDSAGNKACYTMRQQATTATPDTTPPVPGNSGTITTGSVTYNSLILNWTAGTDNATGPLDLQYAVYQSTSGNISTVTDCEANGSLIQNYTANLTTKTATGLSASTTYYFNVVVRDSTGNKACYTMKQQATTATPDTTPPLSGNSGTITAGSVTDTSLVLNWTAGTDNVTGLLDLQYAVYQSTSWNISTVTDCEGSGSLIQNYTANLTTKTATGLSVSTTYYFNVVVRDSAGNKACYTMKQQATTATPDLTAPVPGNSGTITAGSVTDTSLVLNWTAGTDNVTGPLDLQYAVYQSTSGSISTVTDCESNGSLIQSYTANLTTKNATGLSASTTYYFNVVVRDSAGNKACYTMKLQATLDYTPGLAFTLINGGVEYSVAQGTANTNGIVTIPEYWLGKKVTAIGINAFYPCSGMTGVTLPSSLARIEMGAFGFCSSLTSLAIPSGLTYIGEGAFGNCSGLTSVTIPSGVTTIENSTFSGCSGLTSVTIPSGVTSIGNHAFAFCSSLTSLTIPNGVTSIMDAAFYACSGLTSLVIPSGITSISNYTCYACSGLKSVTIPASVTAIGSWAFQGCSGLMSIAIPSGVTSLGDRAFAGCSGLTSLTLPSSLTSSWFSFLGCSGLTSANVTIPDGYTAIGSGMFSSCTGLTTLPTFPSSVTSIGFDAFRGCSGLTSVAIPSSVTSIGDSAFAECSSLVNLTIPGSVTSIEQYAFAYCSALESVIIPSSITTIIQYTFANCSNLTSLTIPNSISTIGPGAFAECSSLVNLIIPSSITVIYLGAFANCSSLESVTANPTIPPIIANFGIAIFENCTSLSSILVPDESVDLYKEAPGWETHSTIIFSQ